jgi:hypothetical protein
VNLAVILTAIEDALGPVITAAKGKLTIADAELDAYDMLNLDTDRFRVVLTPSGGDAEEEGNYGGYVSDTLSVFLQMPKPGVVGASKGLHRDVSGRSVSFTARLAWLIAKVRSLTVEHAEIDMESARFIRFKSWDWVRVDGMPATIRAAQIRFEVRYILDSPDTETSATLTAASGLLLTLDGDDYLNVSNGDGTILKRLRLLARA